MSFISNQSVYVYCTLQYKVLFYVIIGFIYIFTVFLRVRRRPGPLQWLYCLRDIAGARKPTYFFWNCSIFTNGLLLILRMPLLKTDDLLLPFTSASHHLSIITQQSILQHNSLPQLTSESPAAGLPCSRASTPIGRLCAGNWIIVALINRTVPEQVLMSYTVKFTTKF